MEKLMKNTIKAAGILYTDGKKVLLLKRSKIGGNPFAWDLAGGRAEEGESAFQNAKRESKEEIGISLRGTRIDKFKETGKNKAYTVFIYKVDKKFKCTLSDEHVDYKWIKIDDLDKFKITPKLEKNIKKYVKVIKNYNLLEEIKWTSFSEWLAHRA
jgi:8-oxo-dGTP pyrophosphatase MutT (NUDIX family)